MDQTIVEIVKLDAEIDARLTASEAACRKTVEEARAKAAAVTEASEHQVRDAIVEYEEQAKDACEQKLAALRADFDRKGDAIAKQFIAQHDTLLEELFRETLRAAEA